MKNSISTTFKNIKKLPLEVSFEQVENWIQQHEYDAKELSVQPFAKIKEWIYLFSKN